VSVQTLTTLDELDRKLRECGDALQTSDDAMRSVFQGFRMAFALDHPADPFSEAYRDFQMRLYERIAGRRYEVAHEATAIDVADCIARPFPFLTQSCVTAGQHFGAIGHLLRSMSLPPGARILELGPGWGNTTLALAQLGFEVTAVDVEARFCEVIRRRAERLGVPVRVVNADFFWVESAAEIFDAVVFFECFHHCADHLRLLRAVQRVVGPEGRVYFGAEPVLADYPVPWGLRMDGEALWAIRQFGWLELGFSERYFRQALLRTGWLSRKSVSADLPWVTVWEATRDTGAVRRFEATDPRLGTATGIKADGVIRIVGSERGYGMYGPYIPLPPGRYRATVHFAADVPLQGELVLDACAARGHAPLGAAPVDIEVGRASLTFDVGEYLDEVEVRLFCSAGACAAVAAVEIEKEGEGAAPNAEALGPAGVNGPQTPFT